MAVGLDGWLFELLVGWPVGLVAVWLTDYLDGYVVG